MRGRRSRKHHTSWVFCAHLHTSAQSSSASAAAASAAASAAAAAASAALLSASAFASRRSMRVTALPSSDCRRGKRMRTSVRYSSPEATSHPSNTKSVNAGSAFSFTTPSRDSTFALARERDARAGREVAVNPSKPAISVLFTLSFCSAGTASMPSKPTIGLPFCRQRFGQHPPLHTPRLTAQRTADSWVKPGNAPSPVNDVSWLPSTLSDWSLPSASRPPTCVSWLPVIPHGHESR